MATSPRDFFSPLGLAVSMKTMAELGLSELWIVPFLLVACYWDFLISKTCMVCLRTRWVFYTGMTSFFVIFVICDRAGINIMNFWMPIFLLSTVIGMAMLAIFFIRPQTSPLAGDFFAIWYVDEKKMVVKLPLGVTFDQNAMTTTKKCPKKVFLSLIIRDGQIVGATPFLLAEIGTYFLFPRTNECNIEVYEATQKPLSSFIEFPQL